MILRGTSKFLKLIGAKPSQLPDNPSGNDAEWYVNLLYLDRRKCLLFTHAATLFSFLVPDVRNADLLPLAEFVVRHIGTELISEGLERHALGPLDATEFVLARATDRKVLGTMNDLAFQCEHEAAYYGGLHATDIRQLNHRLRRIPYGAIGYAYAIDLVKRT